MDEVRNWDACQTNRFAGTVSGDEGVELGGQLAGLRGVKGAAVGVAFDVGFDRVGELQSHTDRAGAGMVKASEVGW